MDAFRFLPPAGTPIGIADVAGSIRHALTDSDTLQRFEEAVCKRVAVRHCTFVSTGRAALTLSLLALKTLDGGRRDEVVIPSYTCFSVPSSVMKAGLKVRLADVDPTTLDYAPGVLERLDGSRVLAVVATSLYGLPSDLPTITRLAHDRGVFVVDDAAQCLGGAIGGRPSGTWGDVGIYSLDKGKNITSIDGGVLVTNSDRLAAAITDRTKMLPNCTLGESAIHLVKLFVYAALLHPRGYWLPNALPFLGLGTTAYRTDYPLAQYDPWMAPMGRRLFTCLDIINGKRISNADWLKMHLPWGPRLESIQPRPSAVPAYLRFPVLVDPAYRDAVVAALRGSGIGATASYPTAISDVPELKDSLRSSEQDAMMGRVVAARIVTLPTHGYVTARDQERIVRVITDVLGGVRRKRPAQAGLMETRIVSSIDSIGLEEDAWNALVDKNETNTVFQTFQWTRSWLKVFGDRYKPLFVSVNDSSGVVAVAPLAAKLGPLGEQVVRFLGDGRADYCDFLAGGDKPQALEAIFEALFASPERWDVIELNNIPSESSTIELVQAICARARQHVLSYDQFTCRTLRVRGHKDAALEIFNKSALRRRQKYFERNGTLRFFNLTGTAVLPYLDQFFKQHVTRWSSGKEPSLFLNECNRMFYRELAVDMAKKEWVLFSVVEFNGEPIAIHYGFDYNGSLLWYKPSFDVTYAKHSPGLVLLRYLIGHAIKHDRYEFDFTIGDEAFKSRFTNHTRKTVSLKIIRNHGRFVIERAKRKLVAAVKRLS